MKALLSLTLFVLSGCHGGARHGPAPSASVASERSVSPPPLDTAWERIAPRLLAAGDTAPDFEGIAQTGMRVRLSAFLDKPVVVYFYGGDGAAEARGFRDVWMRLRERVGMVIGVSLEDRVTHQDFATREELPFLLVSDDGQKIARAFGVPVEGGAEKRVTFAIGTTGKVLRVFPEPAAEGHAAEVERALSGDVATAK